MYGRTVRSKHEESVYGCTVQHCCVLMCANLLSEDASQPDQLFHPATIEAYDCDLQSQII